MLLEIKLAYTMENQNTECKRNFAEWKTQYSTKYKATLYVDYKESIFRKFARTIALAFFHLFTYH